MKLRPFGRGIARFGLLTLTLAAGASVGVAAFARVQAVASRNPSSSDLGGRETFQTLSPEEVLKYSRDAGYITTRIRQLGEANRRCSIRHGQHRECREFRVQFEQGLARLGEELQSHGRHLLLFGEEIPETLRNARTAHREHRFEAAAMALEKLETYVRDGFMYAIGREGQNVWVERKVFLMHYSSTFEWPRVAFDRLVDVIRSYHDGSLEAFGELDAQAPAYQRALLIAQKLSRQAGFQLAEVHVIRTSKVNAYVLGKNVYVTQGILDFYRNDGDLGMVMGHEIGHIQLGHNRRKIIGQGLTAAAVYNPASYLTLTAAPKLVDWIRGFFGREPLNAQGTLGEQMGNALMSRRSKNYELEADAFGMKLSHETLGWEPTRAYVTFRRLYSLIDQNRIYNPVGDLLHQDIHPAYRTHPELDRRVEAASRVAEAIDQF